MLYEVITDHDFRCVEDGATSLAAEMRAVKDADEIATYRKVSAITDEAMEEIEKGVRSGVV